MAQDIEIKYRQFVEQVAATKLVWGLKDKQGWANTDSSGEEEGDVIPFWSDKTLAKACARDEWKGYLPTFIALPEFLESWCVEMGENNVLAGINWDANMMGKEVNGLELALDVLEQLKITATDVKFLNYESVEAFIGEINEVD
ncbi:DUF2750 domain-containing protein [Mucilaginibacter sp. HMF5004]|uniref:DUF2750 domain-containing protein n=1 Tax=Mucilaginibacter rivuli TaxID=2857527 RepID=UPI001C5CF3CB|nr:DUF2750 domain-containing protein [Mucilaginibacter rivuli]MBW4888777.1 DUF2750 domain-containing protein [Mucilaginibacter rivuli]